MLTYDELHYHHIKATDSITRIAQMKLTTGPDGPAFVHTRGFAGGKDLPILYHRTFIFEFALSIMGMAYETRISKTIEAEDTFIAARNSACIDLIEIGGKTYPSAHSAAWDIARQFSIALGCSLGMPISEWDQLMNSAMESGLYAEEDILDEVAFMLLSQIEQERLMEEGHTEEYLERYAALRRVHGPMINDQQLLKMLRSSEEFLDAFFAIEPLEIAKSLPLAFDESYLIASMQAEFSKIRGVIAPTAGDSSIAKKSHSTFTTIKDAATALGLGQSYIWKLHDAEKITSIIEDGVIKVDVNELIPYQKRIQDRRLESGKEISKQFPTEEIVPKKMRKRP